MNNMLKHELYLKDYACFNKDAIRFEKENPDFRGEYFKDIDRIIYSFSYLKYSSKTQVFSEIDDDRLSKRMIHVQLVSKIARTISRALNLNEDLIEAASLGHDIGHVPFGHTGERILNEICLKHNLGYFNHNVQSVRNLMYIENKGKGLNLTLQTLDAILCHNGEIEKEKYTYKEKTKEEFIKQYNNCYIDKTQNINLIPMTLEACVLRISDIIAYIGRDIEDAISLNILKEEDIPLFIKKELGSTNSEIINTLVLDIIKESTNKNYIKLSKSKYEALKKLKEFNYKHIYNKSNTKEKIKYYEKIFNSLFNIYLNELENKKGDIYEYYKKMNEEYKKNNKKRIVVDYIAGMTDNYIIKKYIEYEKMGMIK